MRASVAFRNAALQQADLLDSGFVRFYEGAQPADPDVAITSQVLVVECALSNPAMGSSSGGTRAFNAIGAGIIAADGAPSFARFFRSDGVTAVVDMNVPDEIVLSKSDWVAGESFAGPSVTWNMPVEC